MTAHRQKANDSDVDKIVELGVFQNKQPRSRKTKIDQALDAGIAKIKMTWWKIETKRLTGPYGKQQLLQDVYQVYCDWDDQDIVPEILERLKKGFDVRPNLEIDVLNLLIQAALPEVAPGVVGTWVAAIRYGQHCHVRRAKMRGFLFIRGGLARCARLYRELRGELRDW